jgi:serine/threonine protein kinase
MPLFPGTHLGPYEITGPLGSGGMEKVYRARDTRLERTVAIKILSAQFSADPVRKQRFEREAKTISSLNHPHICTLHDVGSQDGVDYQQPVSCTRLHAGRPTVRSRASGNSCTPPTVESIRPPPCLKNSMPSRRLVIKESAEVASFA